jgi:hypothetical protein
MYYCVYCSGSAGCITLVLDVMDVALHHSMIFVFVFLLCYLLYLLEYFLVTWLLGAVVLNICIFCIYVFKQFLAIRNSKVKLILTIPMYILGFIYLNSVTLYYNNFRGQDNGSIDIRSLSNHMCHIFIVEDT